MVKIIGKNETEKDEKNDIRLIRLALKQEIAAERRYAKHIANVNNERVRNVLKALHQSERKHRDTLVNEMKKFLPSFEIEDDSLWKIEINEEMLKGTGDNVELIKTILTINIEKEKEALKQYKGFVQEAYSDELKKLFLQFSNEESEHSKQLEELYKEII